ncbi:ATPase domain-containing protein [Oxalobacteraceae bacterium A2-2]
MTSTPSTPSTRKPTIRISSGVPGLDDVLCGGLTAERVYLVEGDPGTGKTTLGLQFLLDGLARGERGLYITLSETADELYAVAESHGWSIDQLSIYELADDQALNPDTQQSILHPAEMELGETSRGVMEQVERVNPARVVFDSLSELRLLAQHPLRYRRQILALKQFFSSKACTVLMLDDKTSASDQHLHSIAHGVISLEQNAHEFGRERRRVNIVKMRGIRFRGGYHDYVLERGGIRVFPRLVALEHQASFQPEQRSTGVAEFDALLGGGLMAGTNTLVVGPSGVGKTSVTAQWMVAALQRGEKAAFYLFDEGMGTLLGRCRQLGLDLQPYADSGQLLMRHVDPAELSPGEFAQLLRDAVETDGARFLVIDSLNGYLQAMPGEQFLTLQMHELLSYLNQQGVTTAIILGESGLVGDMHRNVDLSYLSDATVVLRYFEAEGQLRRAITVIKSRMSRHAMTIHEMRMDAGGIRIGEVLTGFEGVLTGLPTYRGEIAMMPPDAHG